MAVTGVAFPLEHGRQIIANLARPGDERPLILPHAVEFTQHVDVVVPETIAGAPGAVRREPQATQHLDPEREREPLSITRKSGASG